MQENIYAINVPSLLSLMLYIGGVTIMTGEHWARQFVDVLCR
jgi:hypothetical protein